MKAAVIHNPGKIKLTDIPVPEPGEHEVLSRVAFCGICGTDYENYKGTSDFVKSGKVHYPLRFGHEWSGTVCKVGSAVKDFKIGDRVVGENRVTCNKCENCLAGRWYDCKNPRSVGTVGNIWPGAMAEYMLMPDYSLVHLPDNISLREGALMEPATIALNGFRNLEVKNKSVLVIGTGAIGLSGVGCAKALGASLVLSAGRKESKLAVAKQMGADFCINTVKEDLPKTLARATSQEKADIVLETSGSTEMVENMIDLTAFMGTFSMIGFYARPLNNFDLNRVILGKISLLGISGARQNLRPIVDMVASGKIDLKPLLTHEIDFSDIEDAMPFYEKEGDTRIKMLVDVGDDISPAK